MVRRIVLAATLLLAASACGPTPTDAPQARPAAAQRDDDPTPPPTTHEQPPADTTQRGGGGTIGSWT